MYDMLISEEDRQGTAFKERARRYKWPIIANHPLMCQLIGDTLRGYIVIWKWRVEGFYLQILEDGTNKELLNAQIPNWEMAEIEDVVDSLLASFREKEG